MQVIHQSQCDTTLVNQPPFFSEDLHGVCSSFVFASLDVRGLYLDSFGAIESHKLISFHGDLIAFVVSKQVEDGEI